MAMITDAVAARPAGVTALADDARAAGASEAEITEAVEVGYRSCLTSLWSGVVVKPQPISPADLRLRR